MKPRLHVNCIYFIVGHRHLNKSLLKNLLRKEQKLQYMKNPIITRYTTASEHLTYIILNKVSNIILLLLQVSMLYSSTVVCDLLQSCYTGVLQFNPEEIVNYLTAASYLQMEHIVERCRGALKKYVQLKNPKVSLTQVMI